MAAKTKVLTVRLLDDEARHIASALRFTAGKTNGADAAALQRMAEMLERERVLQA